VSNNNHINNANGEIVMKVGQVVTSTGINHRQIDAQGKMICEFGFKVPKRGQLLNFIFMGLSDSKSGQIDADQFLRDMGWVPRSEVEKLKGDE